MTLIGETYYGRGLFDDKAPMLICLYVLDELKKSGIECNKKFRFIVGCDEESDWEDVAYFKTKSTLPKYGFSPDGNFPVSYAEKGINKIIFTIPKLKNFYDIKGGTVFNAVCGYCTCKATPNGINHELLEKYNLKLLDGNVIESVGKSCHGSKPELGVNAIAPLFKYFLEMGEDVKTVVDNLFLDVNNLKNTHTPQGNVTFSPDIISEKNGKIVIECDCRVPAPMTLDDLIPIFDKFGIKYKAIMHRAPLYVEQNSELVKILLDSYNQTTGKNSKPVSQSGGTFAYVFEKGCAFGPEFEGEPTSIHEPNECITKEQLLTLYKIYKKAIFDLAQSKDFE
jgi:succinyl-diaminopimelate desuccinylase